MLPVYNVHYELDIHVDKLLDNPNYKYIRYFIFPNLIEIIINILTNDFISRGYQNSPLELYENNTLNLYLISKKELSSLSV